MTYQQAREEAQKLWGVDAPEGRGTVTGDVRDTGTPFGKSMEVGVWHKTDNTNWFETYGQGQTYDEAFADAARRKGVATPARQ